MMGGMVGRGRSVLIVEDDRLTLSLLAETLIQAGFVVGAAANASEARRLSALHGMQRWRWMR